MKKSIILSIAAAAAFATAAFTANTVSAADTTPTAPVTTQAKHATVELTKGTNADGSKSSNIELTAAPDLDFGQVTLSATDPSTGTANPTTSVTVENPGVASGWSVSATLGDFMNGSTVLKGAQVNLAEGSVTNSASGTTDFVGLPEIKTVDLSKDATKIMTATAVNGGFQGVGKTENTRTATLTVPAGNVEGTYTADLTWTLGDTPTDN